MIKNYKNFPGMIAFATGILLGTLLFGGLAWADLEAVFYGLTHLTNTPLNGLVCPPLMTRSEVTHLTVTAHNDHDLPIAPVVRVEISTTGLRFTDQVQVKLAPGQSQSLVWPLSANNIDLNYFVFAKAYRFPDYQTPLAEDTCGILVINAPGLSGQVLLALWLGLSLIFTLLGLWLLQPRVEFPGPRISMSSARRALAIAMFTGIIFGVQGAWLPGVLALVAVILLTCIIILFSVLQ